MCKLLAQRLLGGRIFARRTQQKLRYRAMIAALYSVAVCAAQLRRCPRWSRELFGAASGMWAVLPPTSTQRRNRLRGGTSNDARSSLHPLSGTRMSTRRFFATSPLIVSSGASVLTSVAPSVSTTSSVSMRVLQCGEPLSPRTDRRLDAHPPQHAHPAEYLGESVPTQWFGVWITSVPVSFPPLLEVIFVALCSISPPICAPERRLG